ncbi:MAG: GlsB/YeaQ/YmgE family stress response membrane protein [Pseudomonadota bacterium]|nr:GlsB/YeaQ/YmgE family stress response membrane protein [Pseudomonadota bacterium]
MYNIIWIIVIGFVAGIIARFLSPGPNRANGFILTTVLGIAGAFVATFIGQTIGWYRLDQGAGLIGAIVGALVVLFIWNRLVAYRVVPDPGNPPGPNAPPPRRRL